MPFDSAAQLSLSLCAPKLVSAYYQAEASNTLFAPRKPHQGSGIDDELGNKNMLAIVIGLFERGVRRGPISVRAALGPPERMRIDYAAIRFGSIT